MLAMPLVIGRPPDKAVFITYEYRSPCWSGARYQYPHELPMNLAYWLEQGDWIVNVDLDYFFYEVSADKELGDCFIKLVLLVGGLEWPRDQAALGILNVLLNLAP